MEIYIPHHLSEVPPLTGEPCGLDAGLSEVFTDEGGTRYGDDFGRILQEQSDALCAKGRSRNKLRTVMKKAQKRGNYAKTRRIREYTLGTKKQRVIRRRMKAEVNRQVNTAINHVMPHITSKPGSMTPKSSFGRRRSGSKLSW